MSDIKNNDEKEKTSDENIIEESEKINNEDDSSNSEEPIKLLSSDRESIKDLATQNVLSLNIYFLIGAFMVASMFNIFKSAYTTYRAFTDKTRPVYSCPREYNTDAPVIMKTIKDNGQKSVDRWIRGFMRRYINYQFPRREQEVKPFFSYVSKHSRDVVKYKYDTLLHDIDAVSKIIGGGTYYKYYARDSKDLIIRPIDGSSKWAVSLDVYLVKKIGMKEERYNPTLNFIIETGPANIDNPEGLYVIEANIDQITDFVSGNTKKLN